MINVLLVDDHELVRTGIKRIIDDVRGLKVVGEADSGESAFQFCRANEPDVVLMDMNMTGPEEMIQAIRSVNVGQRYIAPEIAQQIAMNQFNGVKEDRPFDSLSERELQIMLMITKGEKVQDIATQLNLSSKTINSYRYRMFEKLNIGNDVELTHMAIRFGMLDMDML